VIADVFRNDESSQIQEQLGTYFEIEEVIDITINVELSLIK